MARNHWGFFSKNLSKLAHHLKSSKNIFISIVSAGVLSFGLIYTNCGNQMFSASNQVNFLNENFLLQREDFAVQEKNLEDEFVLDLDVFEKPTDSKTSKNSDDQFCATRAPNPCRATVGSGLYFSCMVLKGDVECWGDNKFGQLGNGTAGGFVTSKVPVQGLNGPALDIAVGYYHACALLPSGAVQCWGNNDHGQIGAPVGAIALTPTTVTGITNAVEITAGSHHTCALLSTGQINCWGDNSSGQLGNGSTVSSNVPVAIPTISNSIVAAGQSNTCAVSAGQAYCWGDNSSGQVGNGIASSVPVVAPFAIPGMIGVVSIDTGSHSCAVLSSGAVQCWGNNTMGETLGTSMVQPIPVSTGVLNATQVSTGALYTCAILSTKKIECWGSNSHGQLGFGGSFGANNVTPRTVSNISSAIEISAGASHICSVSYDSDLDIHCWGNGHRGALGNSGEKDFNVPVEVVKDFTCCEWRSTSTVNAPSPRHSNFNNRNAVWTGTGMIIWGGVANNLTNIFNDGARYNPNTNVWNTINPIGAPSARFLHTALWAGPPVNKMIVWGGGNINLTTPYNDGGLYDPVTNSWSPISTVNAPSPRYGHTAVWTGTEMIVWAGSPSGIMADGARYNPQTNVWTPMNLTGATSARSMHAAIWAGPPVNKMIVWGGYGWNGSIFGNLLDGGMYDPAANAWTSTNLLNAPSERRIHTAVWTGVEMIVFGGLGGATGSTNLDTGGKFNPISNTWSPMTNSPQPTAWHSAVWADGAVNQMFVWGNGMLHAYDPMSNLWSPLCPLAAPIHADNFIVWTGTELIDWGGNPANSTNTGWIYTP